MQAPDPHLVVRLADADLGLLQPLGHPNGPVGPNGKAALQDAPVDIFELLLLEPHDAGAGVSHDAPRLDLLRLIRLARQRLQLVLDDRFGHLRV